MSKECPPHQILNPATNRCVNRDGAIGRKILLDEKIKNELSKQNITNYVTPIKTNKCPDGKILNPATNRCVDINGAIGKKLLRNDSTTNNSSNKSIPGSSKDKVADDINYFNMPMTTSKCKKKLNVRIDQCKCPICWIVGAIVAIKFSNIHKYFEPEYKKVVKDAYNIFSDTSHRGDKCPYIPSQVIDKYIQTLRNYNLPLDDRNMLLKRSGISNIFIYSLLDVGLKKEYRAWFLSNMDEKNRPLSKYAIKASVIVNSDPLPNGISLSNTKTKDVVDMLDMYKNKYYKLGYIFKSGIFLTSIKKGDNHVVAFTECDNKYYICNSYDTECVEIKSSNRYKSYISPLKKIIMVTFILTPL